MAAKEPGLIARRVLQACLAATLLLLAFASHAVSQDIAPQARYAIDPSARLDAAQVEGGAVRWQPVGKPQPLRLDGGALWLQLELPALDPSRRWYVFMPGGASLNHASLFTRDAQGRWVGQRAGDRIPVAAWDHPNATPLFEVRPGPAQRVYLRLQNEPAPVSLFVRLMDEKSLDATRQWTHLGLGAYLGFSVLVLIVGLIHGRLYRDRSFYSYCSYVVAMLLFQLAYTGVGGLFFWPHSAAFNDASPALFMLLMTAAGIWNIRESVALQRHSRLVDRGVLGFSLFGVAFAAVYTLAPVYANFVVLNLYGLAAVVLSIGVCLWTWRRGERYSLWLFFGFLPVHLAYPFPALRAAGVLPDNWAAQYAVLIGSAIEIPLLLYILHWRAKDYSENRARLRALDSTDPLTGLAVVPVLLLRLRDALRRARRLGHRCSVLLVELSNHGEIVQRAGGEAGDRALVVAASRLVRLVREIDTVCRIEGTRFAILTEGPQQDGTRIALAQHIVARGLEPVSQLPADTVLRFKVVTAWAPEPGESHLEHGAVDEQRLLRQLGGALDALAADSRRVLNHLGSTPAA